MNDEYCPGTGTDRIPIALVQARTAYLLPWYRHGPHTYCPGTGTDRIPMNDVVIFLGNKELTEVTVFFMRLPPNAFPQRFPA